LDNPHIYIKDVCLLLKYRWDPNNAAPGTVVMPIMVHGVINGDETPTEPYNTNHNRLEILMRDLNQQGFVTITTQQLCDFLDHNAKIPSRSSFLLSMTGITQIISTHISYPSFSNTAGKLLQTRSSQHPTPVRYSGMRIPLLQKVDGWITRRMA